VNALVKDYKSSVKTAKGEEFDPSPENLDKTIIRTDLKGGPKLSLLSKKSRGEQVNMTINLRFGDESSMKGRSTEAGVVAQMLMRGTVRHTRQQIKDESTVEGAGRHLGRRRGRLGDHSNNQGKPEAGFGFSG
jgi:zinc protease